MALTKLVAMLHILCTVLFRALQGHFTSTTLTGLPPVSTRPSGEAPKKLQALTKIPASSTVIPRANDLVHYKSILFMLRWPQLIHESVQQLLCKGCMASLAFHNPKFEAIILNFLFVPSFTICLLVAHSISLPPVCK